MRKIVSLALAAGAALVTIAPALADLQVSAECPEMDRLRATANSVHRSPIADADRRTDWDTANEQAWMPIWDLAIQLSQSFAYVGDGSHRLRRQAGVACWLQRPWKSALFLAKSAQMDA
jgi:hypothetical protein